MARLTRRMPVIGRIDGKAFHTFTRGMEKPFDEVFQRSMLYVAVNLCKEIQGCKLAYVQSDEISLLLTDYDEFETEAWFDYRINKMNAVAASIASSHMTLMYEKMALFDARFFNVPKEDVCNYFVWRQRDAVKNSINMYAQSMFPHGRLQWLNGNELQELMWQEKQFNWNAAPVINKRGAAVIYTPLQNDRHHWEADHNTPDFGKDRSYIEWHLLNNEERTINTCMHVKPQNV